ncbi:hypothetical protein Tco_0438843 [Tanacetum coccineum]
MFLLLVLKTVHPCWKKEATRHGKVDCFFKWKGNTMDNFTRTLFLMVRMNSKRLMIRLVLKQEDQQAKRKQTLAELNETKGKQVEVDTKAVNLELMEGTELTKQEQETKLADEFDEFTLENGESIQTYYLRFSKMMNDMIINGIEMSQIQVNIKFLNHLQPEWKLYVTVFKQTNDLHKVNYDQLFAYLKQNQDEANEIQAERAVRHHDPLALVANTYNTPQPSPYTNQASQYNKQMSYKPRQSHEPVDKKQSLVSPTSSSNYTSQEPELLSLAIPTFEPNDNLIESLNKDMFFLRNTTGYAGNVTKNAGNAIYVRNNLISTVEDYENVNAVKVIKCNNCKATRYYVRQCTKKKRMMHSTWFRDKMLLAKNEEAGIPLEDDEHRSSERV